MTRATACCLCFCHHTTSKVRAVVTGNRARCYRHLATRYGWMRVEPYSVVSSLPIPRRLHREQFLVESFAGEELIVRSLLFDFAVPQHDDPIGHAHRGESVRN